MTIKKAGAIVYWLGVALLIYAEGWLVGIAVTTMVWGNNAWFKIGDD